MYVTTGYLDEDHHVVTRPLMERDPEPSAEGRHHYNESLDRIDNPAMIDDDDKFNTMIVRGNGSGANGVHGIHGGNGANLHAPHPSQDPIVRSSSDVIAENGRTGGGSMVSSVQSVQSIGSIKSNSDGRVNQSGNRPSDSSLGFEPGSVLDHYVQQV